MSEYPTPHTVGLHVWTGTGEDDHGNMIDTYAPPLDQPGAAHAVYGWAVPTSAMPAVAGHDRVVVDVELLVPPGFPAKPRDVIDLSNGPTGQFAVVGEVQGTDGNPFEWVPGGIVNLQRVDG